jgi:hypothetical protein
LNFAVLDCPLVFGTSGHPLRVISKKPWALQTTGRGSGILVRVHGDLANRLDSWAAVQQDHPSRPKAVGDWWNSG